MFFPSARHYPTREIDLCLGVGMCFCDDLVVVDKMYRHARLLRFEGEKVLSSSLPPFSCCNPFRLVIGGLVCHSQGMVLWKSN